MIKSTFKTTINAIDATASTVQLKLISLCEKMLCTLRLTFLPSCHVQTGTRIVYVVVKWELVQRRVAMRDETVFWEHANGRERERERNSMQQFFFQCYSILYSFPFIFTSSHLNTENQLLSVSLRDDCDRVFVRGRERMSD